MNSEGSVPGIRVVPDALVPDVVDKLAHLEAEQVPPALIERSPDHLVVPMSFLSGVSIPQQYAGDGQNRPQHEDVGEELADSPAL